MHCTRSYIVFTICKLSTYISNPSIDNWKAITKVFGYIKRTMNFRLFYNNFLVVLEGYIDSSWITSASDNKSTFGWLFILEDGVVSWALKKQTCITYFTIESKFIALATTSKETKWLRNVLLDIKLWSQPMSSISLYCNSQISLEHLVKFTMKNLDI
jgi:hypothetical protein